MPLSTREGVAEAPIEPGARTLWEPWDLGPLAKLWRLIVPWKPLPLEVPRDLHAGAGAEGLDRDRLPELAEGLARASLAELGERAHRRRVGLPQVPELGLW